MGQPPAPLTLTASETIASVLDSEGRPLGEVKAAPQALAGIPMTVTRCPYSGSRHQHPLPMNTSALKQMGAHWDELRVLLPALQSLVRDRGEASAAAAWQAAQAGELLPRFLLRRRGDVVPARVAVVYKVVAGLRLTLKALAAHEVLHPPRPRPLSAAEVLETAEAHGHLIGMSQVCAGPPEMIAEAAELLLRGGGDLVDLTTAMSEDQPEPIQRFVAAGIAFESTKFAFAVLRREILQELLVQVCRILGQESPPQRALLPWIRTLVELEQRFPPDGSVAHLDLLGKPDRDLQLQRIGELFPPSLRRCFAQLWESQLPGPIETLRAFVDADPGEFDHVLQAAQRYLRLAHAYGATVIELEGKIGEPFGDALQRSWPDQEHLLRTMGSETQSFFEQRLAVTISLGPEGATLTRADRSFRLPPALLSTP